MTGIDAKVVVVTVATVVIVHVVTVRVTGGETIRRVVVLQVALSQASVVDLAVAVAVLHLHRFRDLHCPSAWDRTELEFGWMHGKMGYFLMLHGATKRRFKLHARCGCWR